jgi:hypothetical protein
VFCFISSYGETSSEILLLFQHSNLSAIVNSATEPTIHFIQLHSTEENFFDGKIKAKVARVRETKEVFFLLDNEKKKRNEFFFRFIVSVRAAAPQSHNVCKKSKNSKLTWNGAFWGLAECCKMSKAQSSYDRNEKTGTSNLLFPFNAESSITTRHPSMTPPAFLTNSQAALSEPPVASKSSTIKIF